MSCNQYLANMFTAENAVPSRANRPYVWAQRGFCQLPEFFCEVDRRRHTWDLSERDKSGTLHCYGSAGWNTVQWTCHATPCHTSVTYDGNGRTTMKNHNCLPYWYYPGLNAVNGAII